MTNLTVQSSAAQDKASCPSIDDFKIDGRPARKGKLKAILWAWRGHLVKAKQEVDMAWRMVLEGLEALDGIPSIGLIRKPYGGGSKTIEG